MENPMSEQTTQEAAPVEQAQAPAGPSLTVSDLVMTAQIIQRAAQAGIFKAEELKGVGDYYDRLIKFLESSGAISRAQAPTTAPQGE